ncbi:MAG: class IV adenylate cyclase [Chloroflexi bacterium]|nr:class IV adenylate cyclase [Chloroflexota bacterium]MBI1855085.1 class IV adenylate cyclase [Chloroflexota bacterium]MBI3339831.1 class IV adenylate cyclase [Chloroflexota bacterium]
MAEQHQEVEAKFYISSLSDIEMRLRKLEAHLPGPRVREVNLRFDKPDGEFQRAGKVLRLRRDGSIHLTYKDGSRSKDGAISRREIEFEVSNFETARCFIEALGYQVIFLYEKYRTTYELDGARVMLDETPIGSFVEIEGELDSLRPVAKKLGLDWNTAIPASYHALFERVCKARGFTFRDLSFENFKGVEIRPDDFGAHISMNNTEA